MKQVVLFGASSAGRAVLQWCQQLELNVICFLDNDPGKWGSQIKGIPVRNPHEFFESQIQNYSIIIASQHDIDISRQLKTMGMDNIISIHDLSGAQPKNPHTTTSSRLFPKEFERNKVFYKKHKGERCFILATGPSINSQNLRPLYNEICLGVGMFFLHRDTAAIRPMYYVQAPNHAPFTFDSLKTYYAKAHACNVHEPHYFIGHAEYEFSMVRFFIENPDVCPKHYSYINYNIPESLNEKNFDNPLLWDICGSPFAPLTVVYEAIQIAAYMGFLEIYLVGVDHDYLHDITRVQNHHFYREEEGVSDVEHLSQFTTERWLKEYYCRWRDYRLMNTYLQERGVTIYNATEGGMLDVFPRVSFKELFGNV